MIANPKFVVFAVAVLGLVLLPSTNTTQNETQTIQTQTVNITVFAVEMGASVTIWKNNTQTNQTFFMDGTWSNKVSTLGSTLESPFDKSFPFPFLNTFTINNRSFTIPTTGVYDFGKSALVQGAIRANFYFGPMQFVEWAPSQWKLYSLNMSSQWDAYMIKKFGKFFADS